MSQATAYIWADELEMTCRGDPVEMTRVQGK